MPPNFDKPPVGIASNLAEPICLTDVWLVGDSAEAARAGDKLKVLTRVSMTSDNLLFHNTVESLGRVIAQYGQKAGKSIALDRANSVLLVIHPDHTAKLWVDTVAVSLLARMKRSVEAGALLYERDFVDVTGMWFPAVDIQPADKMVYLFRQDWRFGLFFDFNPEGKFSVEEATRDLGSLFRQLKYRHTYDLLANEEVFDRLVRAGWFPFVEIIGNKFRRLASTCEAGFELEEEEGLLLEKFDSARLNHMFERWLAKPEFKSKERIFRSALNAFEAQDSVAVVKIVLTEIEGVLREAHKRAAGRSAPTKELWKFAVALAEQKAGGPNTLMFPSAFAQYLEAHTFASFDPMAPSGCAGAGSRHAVGHGAADADSYTQVRALQALLTLDQLAFYI